MGRYWIRFIKHNMGRCNIGSSVQIGRYHGYRCFMANANISNSSGLQVGSHPISYIICRGRYQQFGVIRRGREAQCPSTAEWPRCQILMYHEPADLGDGSILSVGSSNGSRLPLMGCRYHGLDMMWTPMPRISHNKGKPSIVRPSIVKRPKGWILIGYEAG